jgi:hypothetical protein
MIYKITSCNYLISKEVIIRQLTRILEILNLFLLSNNTLSILFVINESNKLK